MIELSSGAAILATILILVLLSRISAMENRLELLLRLNGKIDALLKHAGVDFKPYENLSAAVSRELQLGNKLKAIKLYRAETGVGLKEAKEFIEKVQEW